MNYTHIKLQDMHILFHLYNYKVWRGFAVKRVRLYCALTVKCSKKKKNTYKTWVLRNMQKKCISDTRRCTSNQIPYSLGFSSQGQRSTKGSGGHRNQRAAALVTSGAFWITFYRGDHGRVSRDQLHFARVHTLSWRGLDHRNRLDLWWWCCCCMFWSRCALELGVWRMGVVMMKAARVGVMVVVVIVWMML